MAVHEKELEPGWIAPDTWGSRLKRVRKMRGWTQEQLAEAAGVSPGTLSNWEAGDRVIGLSTPSIKIAAGAGCDLLWLMTGVQNFDPRDFNEQDKRSISWETIPADWTPPDHPPCLN